MRKKISIIGAGNIGAALAQLVTQGAVADVILYDIIDGVPQGKALDILQACSLLGSSSIITGTNDFVVTKGSDILVITAGFPRKPGMNRDDLLNANAKVVSGITANISRLSPDAIIIVVTNPMDVMAQLALRVSGFNTTKVIGMGGILDSARFKTFISTKLNISTKDIEALVLGGHGDLMVPMPRFTTVKGISIIELMTKDEIDNLIQKTRFGGAEIVSLLKTGSAYYAPALATFEMIKSIVSDEKRLVPCSVYLNGQYGLQDVYAGVPAVLGDMGVEKIVELNLTQEEHKELEKSAEAVKKLFHMISI